MKKTIICTLLILGLALSLPACGSAPAEDLQIDVAPFILYDAAAESFVFDTDGFLAAAGDRLTALAHSFVLTVGEDMTTLTLSYDQALAREAGVTLVHTRITFPKEVPGTYLPPVEQTPEVL